MVADQCLCGTSLLSAAALPLDIVDADTHRGRLNFTQRSNSYKGQHQGEDDNKCYDHGGVPFTDCATPGFIATGRIGL
jgi:hypothetical protein